MELRETLAEAEAVVQFLIEQGLADDYNFPYQNGQEITFRNAQKLSLALKSRPYPEVYADLLSEGVFTVKFPDSALLQMSYLWDRESMLKHRLAYMPNPDLVSFQEAPELYEDDAWYADMLSASTVVVPVRFDFDCSTGVPKEFWHPISHLTLGSFENCRIAVSSAMPPAQFVAFILKAFYSRKMQEIQGQLPKFTLPKPHSHVTRSITAVEEGFVHINIPLAAAV